MRGGRWCLLAAALLPLLAGCGSQPAPGRILLVGLDGMDPETVDLLIAEGKLPNFARLRREGAYGLLESSRPMLSPILWNTIATGKTPDQHGIGHFVAINPKTGEQLPVTSQMRKVKAVWDILSDAGRPVAVVGWWATWPAEKIHGAVVSDHTCYHFLFPEGMEAARDTTGITYPPELLARIEPLIQRPTDLSPKDVARFVRVSAEEFNRPFDFNDGLSHFKWALATARSYRDIGLKLWRERQPDLLMVYIEGTDSTAHLFGHLFRVEGLSGELAEQQRRFGGAVEQMYRYADALIGQYLKALDERTTLVVLSDHGFELGALQDDPSKTRDMRRVSEKYHRIEGILYLYGYRVRRGAVLQRTTQLDITPTLLALSGLPKAADMPGRVLTEALELEIPGPPVASYETEARPGTPGGGDSKVDAEILARLRSLGYLDSSSPQGDRNIAAMHFEAGRFDQAIQAFTELVAKNPEDAGLHASLAGALGAVGRYDESLEHLSRSIELEPLNVEAYHNRGVIYERKGQPEAAIEQYRTALRYNPMYEPSLRALQGLGAAPEGNTPKSDTERQAAQLAESASLAARRGNYPEAMRLLRQAERIAPRYTLVYQYQSNVAYLMGDRQAAIAALERGLELEPGNALFQNNLKELRGGAQ